MPPVKAVLAEFVGTFALMFVGGAAMITGGDNLLAIALAHGLILAVMVSATMHISGGQINPAVSIALWIIKKQSAARTGMFMAAQLLGAVLAAVLLKALLAGPAFGTLGATLTLGEFSRDGGEHISAARTLGLELIATFFLMFVIMGTAIDKRGVGKTAAIGGLAIGLTVAAAILCIGPATGASLNPARSFGPALVAEGGAWDMHWAYWVGPIIGAAMAALAYRVVLEEDQ